MASLFPLPDTWALLAGLILTDLRTTSKGELPDLLEVARARLVKGGWPDRVSSAFVEALISVLAEPRYMPGVMPDKKYEKHASLLELVRSDLAEIEAGEPDRSRQRLTDRISEELSHNWWLEHDPELVDKLLGAPEDAKQTLENAILSAVEHAQEFGAPDIPEVHTVRYGWTLFGDPNRVT